MKYWLFYFFKIFLYFPFRFFSKNIFIDGLENLPSDKPILIASNHPNSFLDGTIIEHFLRRRVYTLVRGDMFRKPIANMLLRSMRLIPIFRARDARADVARAGNNSSYDECYQLFKKNGAILIFPEGDSYPEKNVRPLKKGTAQLAADMFQRGNLDIHVVPCGLNYSHFYKWRSTIQIAFGKPIAISEWQKEFEDDNRKFAVNFTKLLEERIQELVVTIPEDVSAAKDTLQDIHLNNINEVNFFKEVGKGANLIANHVDTGNVELTEEYVSKLKNHQLNDRAVSGNGLNYGAMVLGLFTAAVSIPYAIVMWLIWNYAHVFAKKKVKNILFFDSILFGVGTILGLLFYLITFIVFLIVFPWHWAIILVIAAAFGSLAWIRIIEEFRQIKYELRYIGLSQAIKLELQDLRSKIVIVQ